MKITVHSSSGQNITLPFPNAMLFSPTVVKLVLKLSETKTNHTMPDIPPETVDDLCRAIKLWNKTHGEWELVHVESAGGNTVIITI